MRVTQRRPFVHSSPTDKVGVEGPATVLLGRKEKLLPVSRHHLGTVLQSSVRLEFRQLNTGA